MDYNIYIHTDGAGNSNPTVPWSDGDAGGGSFQSNTQPWSNGISKAANIAQNPDGLVAGAFSKLAKAIPAIAVATAVVHLTDKIATTIIDFNTIESGDYTAQLSYNNFKAGIKAAFHPVSTWINFEKQKRINRLSNEVQKANLALLGDSYINSFNGYGV